MVKQEQACKNCGYRDIWHDGLIAQWFEISHITHESIEDMKCERCNNNMQIHHQTGRRRFYKCWNCGMLDAIGTVYENGTQPFSEMDAITRYYHDPAHYKDKEKENK
jgi:hypothetical protein